MKARLLMTGMAILLLGSGCTQKEENRILTVRGPIAASELGVTLVHEHVLVDFA